MAAPLIYLVAGEPSGDLLGGRLMAALSEETEGAVRFAGIGGEMMTEQGLDSLFPMAELSVMGFTEVVPRIPHILRRVSQTVDDIVRQRPAALITIDSWGFTGRVVRAVQKRCPDIPRIHYVAPMVWAWKEGRARTMARSVDHLLTLLPNEPPYFVRHGLEATHVGHAVIESGAGQGNGAAFRARHGIAATAPLLCVLPGSRHSEVSRLLPLFEETVHRLVLRYPALSVTVPTVETVEAEVRKAVETWKIPRCIVRGREEKYDAFAASDAALAASGTIALELAMAEVPMLIAYKVSPVSAFLARRFLKIRYACLINLLLQAPVVPELLQENCTPENLADGIDRLLSDSGERERQKQACREAMKKLGYEDVLPSRRAAAVVLEIISKRETHP